MKLPNGQNAIVAIEKLTSYALNIDHAVGGHKALVFRSALGLTVEHAEMLRTALLQAAATADAVHKGTTNFGERYEIRFEMTGPNGSTKGLISGWQIDTGTNVPRLVSVYVDS